MKRTLLLILFAVFCMGQDYGSGIPVVSVQPFAAPLAPLTVVCQMDFEDGSCEDGDSDDSCASGVAGTGYDPDCTVGAINGTYSGCNDHAENNWMDFTADCAETTKVTIDFTVNFDPGDTLNDNGQRVVVGAKFDGGNFAAFTWQETVERLDFACGDDTGYGTGELLDANTEYNIRMDLDGSDHTCTFYVDTVGGDPIGTGTVMSGGPYDSDNTPVDINGFFQYHGVGLAATIVDDVGICDVTDFLAVGVRCEH
jgi:hypothetical protein